MATTIPHRELRNSSSEILRRVASGEVFEITNNGVVVAELRKPEAKGLESIPHRKAIVQGRFTEIESVESPVTSQEVLDYLRGDR